MIKEIEKLNREIDRIMTEKTKADAQKEVWESRLVESIGNYNKEYGVNLSGKDLAEIKKKLVAETNIVEAKTKEEYEKSLQIVNLINEGDIKGAWKVLGVDIDAVNNQTEEEPQEEVQETKIPVPTGNQSIQGATEVVEEMEDEDFFGESFEDEEPIQEVKPQMQVNKKVVEASKGATVAKTFNPFVMEDDDDEEDEFVIPNTETSNSSNKSTTGSLIMEDDEDDDFGGFGSILAGSKFKV